MQHAQGALLARDEQHVRREERELVREKLVLASRQAQAQQPLPLVADLAEVEAVRVEGRAHLQLHRLAVHLNRGGLEVDLSIRTRARESPKSAGRVSARTAKVLQERWEPGRARTPMVDLHVDEKTSSTKRVIRHVLPTPASPTTSSLKVVE